MVCAWLLQQPGALAQLCDRVGSSSETSAYGHAASGTMETRPGDQARRYRETLPDLLHAGERHAYSGRECHAGAGEEIRASNSSAIGRRSHPPAKSRPARLRLIGNQNTRRRYAGSRSGGGHRGQAGDQAQLAGLLRGTGRERRARDWLRFALEPRDPDQARPQLRRPECARFAPRRGDRFPLRRRPRTNPRRKSRA